jgi:hypothetical protein
LPAVGGLTMEVAGADETFARCSHAGRRPADRRVSQRQQRHCACATQDRTQNWD